ncbi:MAG: FAD-binding oxidoreductase, partial [Anaerolineae bacterium]|nr:FAD-binding oxidoreductase [Anaerolineae bacterium]
MTQGRIIPTSVEFMDSLSVQTAYAYLEERLPHPEIGAMLLVEVDGTSQDQVEAEYNAIV